MSCRSRIVWGTRGLYTQSHCSLLGINKIWLKHLKKHSWLTVHVLHIKTFPHVVSDHRYEREHSGPHKLQRCHGILHRHIKNTIKFKRTNLHKATYLVKTAAGLMSGGSTQLNRADTGLIASPTVSNYPSSQITRAGLSLMARTSNEASRHYHGDVIYHPTRITPILQLHLFYRL